MKGNVFFCFFFVFVFFVANIDLKFTVPVKLYIERLVRKCLLSTDVTSNKRNEIYNHRKLKFFYLC